MRFGYERRHAEPLRRHGKARKALAVAGAGALLAIAGSTGAFADNLQADLNVSLNGPQKVIDLGTLPGSTPETNSVLLFVDENPGPTNNPTYPFNVSGATTAGSIAATFPGVTITGAGTTNGGSANVSFTTPAAGAADATYKVLMQFSTSADVNDSPASIELDFTVAGTGGGGHPCDSVSAPAAPTFDNGGAGVWYTVATTPNATSPGATVTYSTTSGGPYGAAPTLGEGQYTIYAIATEPTCSKTSSESSQPFNIDTAAPSITVAAHSPATGDNSWYIASPVQVDVSASDTVGLASVTCTDSVDGGAPGSLTLSPTFSAGTSYNGSVSVAGDGQHTVSCTAADAAAHQSSDQTTVKLDTTIPTIDGAVTNPLGGPDGHGGWYVTAPTVTFTCDDATSGIASCVADGTSPASASKTLGDSASPQTVSGTAKDNAGLTNITSVTGLMVDTTAPTVTCTTPVPTFILNQSGQSVSAKVADSTSGPAAGTVYSASVDTSTVGGHTALVTGSDVAGNPTTVPCPYSVQYNFSGFLQPINDTAHFVGETTSVFKNGSTVPVKFQLTDANGQVVQEASQPIWLSPLQGSALNSTVTVDESTYLDSATSGSYYRWDSTAQQYIYNWKTSKGQAGYYWRIGVKLDDGTTHFVSIAVK